MLYEKLSLHNLSFYRLVAFLFPLYTHVLSSHSFIYILSYPYLSPLVSLHTLISFSTSLPSSHTHLLLCSLRSSHSHSPSDSSQGR